MLNWDDPRLALLERAGRPAWVWAPRARRIVWATDAAAQAWGLEDALQLIDRPFGDSDPACEDLNLAAQALAHTEGIATRVRLWQAGEEREIPVMARLFARTPDGDLMLVTQQRPRPAPDAERMARASPIADLLGTFPLGLAIFSPAGRCLYANPAFERLFGPAAALTFADLMGSQADGEKLIRGLFGAGSVRASPTLTRQGAEMTLQVDAALVEDPTSRQSAVLVQAHDVTARRARERQLAERFAALKSLLESAIEGWLMLDRSLTVTSLGGTFFEEAPERPEHAIGLDWREAAALFALPRDAKLEAALLAREAITLRLGTEPPRLLTLTPNWSADGDFLGFRLIVTRASEMQKAPHRERSRTRLIDLDTSALIAHDNFDIVYANTRAARLFGAASPKELIGRPFLDLFPDDERRASRHYDAIAQGARTSEEERLAARAPGGDTLIVDAEFRKATLGGRKVILTRFTDVTRLAQAEEALAARSEEGLGWIEAAPTALIIIDDAGTIATANTQAAHLLRLGAGELRGKPFDELIDKADRTAYEIRRAACASMAPGMAAMLEVRLTPRADHTLNAKLAMRPALVGEAQGVVIALTDVGAHLAKENELIEAVAAAQDTSRQKTEFLSSVSHEMRTPLNAIIGFSELMREGRLGPIGNERYAGYIDDIHLSGQHLLSLVNDLLDMSKIEAGRFELSFMPVDIGAVIEQAVRMVRPQAEKKGITLSSDVATDIPPVLADQRALRQILLNLLANAIKFTPGTGQVTAKAGYDPIEGVKIAVSDTGPGMSADELRRALEPYGQVHGRAANDEPGTGLGLPLAKALTEASHAIFRMESEPNKGTSAFITFPMGQVMAEGRAGG